MVTTQSVDDRRTRDGRLMSQRMRIGLAALVALLLVLGVRLFHVQGLDPSGHAQAAVSERLRSVPLPAERGEILDVDGRTLATSVQRYDLVVDQRLIDDFRVRDEVTGLWTTMPLETAISDLASILDAEPEDLAERMEGDRAYSVVARSVTPDERSRALDLDIPGLYAEPVSQRTYPAGAVAGSILGFVGSDGTPLDGIELAQDSALSGTDGERTFEIAGDGVRIPTATFEEIPAEDGQDVRLTIDQDLQWFAQEAIAQKANEYSALWGNVTVMDVRTGEIMAMADSETVDPADPGATDELFRRPLALTQDFEPGSTGKGITFAAALEEGAVAPTDAFTVPNRQEFDGQVINDSMRHETFDMTAAGIFARSYNTGTVMIGNELTEQERYDWMRRVGIGEDIDVGLTSSATSVLRSPEEWDARQPFTTQFGQGYTTTVLHNISQFQTFANDGVRVDPQLIDAYIDPDGSEHPVESGSERIFSSETSQEMLKLMEGVVDHGTATGAQIPGYRVGGKTGTGQAAGEGGGFDGHTTSFIGVAPLDDPQYLVAVTVHRPQGEWRDWTVVDTFSEVMSHVLSTRNVPPSGEESESYDAFTGDDQDRPW
ncbi:peptidoglycan glycosyltransferase [Nesterenkonia sp. PF2B19]|nr:peptidoglycan glycosyltransferase [Nesterenkonia sp. PF2B19]